MNAMTDLVSPPMLKMAPHSLEAEQAVLGILLQWNDAYDAICGLVRSADFYTWEHQIIFSATTALIDQNRPADVITVTQWLKDRGDLKKVQGGFAYLQQLVEAAPSAANARIYAELVQEKAICRALLSASMKIGDLVYENSGRTSVQRLGAAQEILAQVDARSRHGEGTFRALSESFSELLTQLDNKDAPRGLATGYHQLDRMLNPFLPGQLIVVGARPAVGKTSFAVNVATNIAAAYGCNIGMFSMEMTDIEIALRVLSAETEIPAGRFREHRLDEKHWDRINQVAQKMHTSKFYIDHSAGLTIQEITSRARLQAKRIGGFGLLLVDYVQLAYSEGHRGDNRAVEIGAVTSGLKRLAKELNCPVIALSQLNRDSTKSGGKLPTISELRDSGSIEADADTILLLHREFVTTQRDEHKYDATVIVGKQRNGGIGTVRLDYDARLTRFFDADESPVRKWANSQAYQSKDGK